MIKLLTVCFFLILIECASHKPIVNIRYIHERGLTEYSSAPGGVILIPGKWDFVKIHFKDAIVLDHRTFLGNNSSEYLDISLIPISEFEFFNDSLHGFAFTKTYFQYLLERSQKSAVDSINLIEMDSSEYIVYNPKPQSSDYKILTLIHTQGLFLHIYQYDIKNECTNESGVNVLKSMYKNSSVEKK